MERPRDHVAVVTLDRPDRLNALTIDLALDLDASLQETADDDDDVRTIVLTGAGRAFCSGLDLKDYDHGSSPASTGSRGANDLLLTGRVVDAEERLSVGWT